MGELQKRIEKTFKEDFGFELTGDCVGGLDLVLKVVEEAKKEFPGYDVGTALEDANTEEDVLVKLTPLDEIIEKMRLWFEKWFGKADADKEKQ